MAKNALNYGPKPYVVLPHVELPDDASNPLFMERFERDLRRHLEGDTIPTLTDRVG